MSTSHQQQQHTEKQHTTDNKATPPSSMPHQTAGSSSTTRTTQHEEHQPQQHGTEGQTQSQGTVSATLHQAQEQLSQATGHIREMLPETIRQMEPPSQSTTTNLLLVALLGGILAVLIHNFAGDMFSRANHWVLKKALGREVSSMTSMLPNMPSWDTSGDYNLSFIGTGLGHTGLGQHFLEKIGLGPTYHMGEVMGKGEHDKWYKIATTKDKSERQRLLREVLRSYRGAVDFPASLYWKDLMEMYPNASFLFGSAKEAGQSAKDTAQDWARSAARTLGVPYEYYASSNNVMHRGPLLGPGLWLFFHVNPVGMLMAQHFNASYGHLFRRDPQEFAKVYNDWLEEVRKAIPADKIMEYDPRQGWEPLSKFLGLEKPKHEMPMPTVNEREDTTWFAYVLSALGWITMALPLALAGWGFSRFAKRSSIGGGGGGAPGMPSLPNIRNVRNMVNFPWRRNAQNRGNQQHQRHQQQQTTTTQQQQPQQQASSTGGHQTHLGSTSYQPGSSAGTTTAGAAGLHSVGGGYQGSATGQGTLHQSGTRYGAEVTAQ
jgi:hypothetical protein